MFRAVHKYGRKRNRRGQAAVEYVLMLALGALFAIQLTKFFVGANGVLQEGLQVLETEAKSEIETGQGFAGGP